MRHGGKHDASADLCHTRRGKHGRVRQSEHEYFGKVEIPNAQELVYVIAAEPATLDPVKSADRWEGYIIPALFEGLTTLHPGTGEPMAALATHYEISADGLRYRLYLRGHGEPRGIRLPDTGTLANEFANGSLREDYARGRSAPSVAAPARWNDGEAITADDVVYSWRRAIDPATAAIYGYLLWYVRNAEEISSGKRKPAELSVRAVDRFCVEAELRTPTPFFLQLLSHRVCYPVPRRAIEAAGASGSESLWTEPGRIVVSGAFTLPRMSQQTELFCPETRIITRPTLSP